MKQFPEFRLVPEPVGDDAKTLVRPSYMPPEIGTRHKVGGAPGGHRSQPFPRCESCAQEMTFYGQLDCIPGAAMIADAALVHVFVCFGCFTAAADVQSY